MLEDLSKITTTKQSRKKKPVQKEEGGEKHPEVTCFGRGG